MSSFFSGKASRNAKCKSTREQKVEGAQCKSREVALAQVRTIGVAKRQLAGCALAGCGKQAAKFLAGGNCDTCSVRSRLFSGLVVQYPHICTLKEHPVRSHKKVSDQIAVGFIL